MNNPNPIQIKAERQKLSLTQTQSAELIHSKMRTWQDWEGGQRKMHPAFWELFLIKSKVK